MEVNNMIDTPYVILMFGTVAVLIGTFFYISDYISRKKKTRPRSNK